MEVRASGSHHHRSFCFNCWFAPTLWPNYASTWFLKQQWVQPSPSRRSWLCRQTFAHWSVFGTKEKGRRLEEQKHHSPIPATGGRKELCIHKHTHSGRSKTAGLRNSVQLFAGNNHLSDRSRGIQKRNMGRERDMASNSFLCPITILMKSQNLETGCYGTWKPRGNKGSSGDLSSPSAQLQHIGQRRLKLKKWLLQVAEPHRLRQETFKMLCKAHWKCEQIIHFGRLD